MEKKRSFTRWICPQCTLENFDVGICSACQYPEVVVRKVIDEVYEKKTNLLTSSEAARIYWSCPRCTFNNSLIDPVCQVCETPRVDVKPAEKEIEKEEPKRIWFCGFCDR